MRPVSNEIVHAVDMSGVERRDVVKSIYENPKLVDLAGGGTSVPFSATKRPGTWHWHCGKSVTVGDGA